ncbi:response regulator transcription factor [Streptomyces colonosanans]|uniref:DNA-binding response regulator n=1 Tax=Streptomyces colonosanans TaxID=1428652 RepID=A0A1S2Q538_9ACTN|nr:response regulator transcription factor [Streptomyces colonosanans]OIK01164.1 DNA-binding response regulator [Streptomyces colonosanans]
MTGFRLILTSRGIEVVGEAADGVQAVAEAERLRPDVVLMDVRMPNLDGLEAAERVLRLLPHCRVLVLTTFDLDRYVYAALAAGASGFLLKDVTAAHLTAAVRLVNTGDALLAPSISRRLVERYATAREAGRTDTSYGPAAATAVHLDLAPLPPRELEVLTLMGRGLSNTELAEALTLSEATVKTHVARIFAKLALRDRAQAVVLAYETGLVAPGGSSVEN